jgi:DNA polymerase delta subunit 1
MLVDIFPVDWQARDVSSDDVSSGDVSTDPESASSTAASGDSFEIQLYGKTPEGQSKTIHIAFYPYFFVAIPPSWSAAKVQYFIGECTRNYNAYKPLSVQVTRKTLHGFTNNRQHPFVQLAFTTLTAFRKARFGLQRQHMQVYEGALDPLLRFYHVRDLQPGNWVSVETPDPAARHIYVDFRAVSPSTRTDQPPLIFASWDIEAISATNKFPSSDNPGDKIITIGTAYQRYGEPEPFHRSVVTLDTCDSIEGVHVVPCETEAELLNAWIDDVMAHDVDVMVGYNTFQFDFRYVYGRTMLCVDEEGSPQVQLSRLGKSCRPRDNGTPVEKELSSAAYGDNKFFVLGTPGIMQVDLLQIFRKELKLDSYSLNNVSKTYLDGFAKLDLLPGDIFKKFRGTAQDRAVIAEYCVRDVELPLKLMQKMSTFENLLEMANATFVPLEYLIMRGQQIKVFSLLLRKARALGFVAPDVDRKASAPDGKYEGATVLEAQKGGYLNDIVSGLDFASLYPSIMRAWNICPSTLVLNEQLYGGIEGVEYYTVQTGDGKTHKFAQNVPSVVPVLLEELAAFRKQAKKDMALAKERGDTFKAALYNGKQLAFKVSMNSVYGFFGAVKGGMFPCVAVASSVTATGRAMIEHSKKLAETLLPGTRVIYGDTDSIMCILKIEDETRQDDMHAHFETAQWLANTISATFKKPIELEFEKCYRPYLLFTKKRYAGLMYTKPDAPDYVDVKGLQLVRRDSAPVVKAVSTQILDSIMQTRTVQGAIQKAQSMVAKVLQNDLPLESYIVSKQLRANYANPASQPHVVVAKKIQQRRGYPITQGERVPYVFIEDKLNADGLISSRAEDPAFVRENQLRVDTLYYLRNQLMNPIATLLELLVDDVEDAVLGTPAIQKTLEALEAERKKDIKTSKRIKLNASRNQPEITKFFKFLPD